MESVKSTDYSYLERLLMSLSDTSDVNVYVENGGRYLSIDLDRYPNRDYAKVNPEEGMAIRDKNFVKISWYSLWTYGDMTLLLFPEEPPIYDGSWLVVKYPVKQIISALRGMPTCFAQEITEALIGLSGDSMSYIMFPRTQVKVADKSYFYKNKIYWRNNTCLVAEPIITEEHPEEVADLLRSFASQPEKPAEEDSGE